MQNTQSEFVGICYVQLTAPTPSLISWPIVPSTFEPSPYLICGPALIATGDPILILMDIAGKARIRCFKCLRVWKISPIVPFLAVGVDDAEASEGRCTPCGDCKTHRLRITFFAGDSACIPSSFERLDSLHFGQDCCGFVQQKERLTGEYVPSIIKAKRVVMLWRLLRVST